MMETSRFDVILNEEMTRLFDNLAEQDGVSRVEIFKRAMATYALLKEQQRSGSTVVVKVGSVERELRIV